MIAAKSYETDVWQCPNCGSPISKSYKCIGCATQFSVEGCVVDLRPQNFEQVKHGEDAVFAEGSPELNKYRERPWMFIVGRKEITRFTNEIVDQLPSGRFLEIGGETCWAASLFKSIHPNSIVYGSDISPNSLRNAAIPVSKMFPSAPDYLVAADAESLPFADEVFDSIFATTMIHHLPNPSRMMDEVFRVLKPGG